MSKTTEQLQEENLAIKGKSFKHAYSTALEYVSDDEAIEAIIEVKKVIIDNVSYRVSVKLEKIEV